MPIEIGPLVWLAGAPPMPCMKKLRDARFPADQHSTACAASDGLRTAAAGVAGAGSAGKTAVAVGTADVHSSAADSMAPFNVGTTFSS